MAAVERTQEESEEGGQMGGGVLSLEAAWTPLTARFCSTPKKKSNYNNAMCHSTIINKMIISTKKVKHFAYLPWCFPNLSIEITILGPQCSFIDSEVKPRSCIL